MQSIRFTFRRNSIKKIEIMKSLHIPLILANHIHIPMVKGNPNKCPACNRRGKAGNDYCSRPTCQRMKQVYESERRITELIEEKKKKKEQNLFSSVKGRQRVQRSFEKPPIYQGGQNSNIPPMLRFKKISNEKTQSIPQKRNPVIREKEDEKKEQQCDKNSNIAQASNDSKMSDLDFVIPGTPDQQRHDHQSLSSDEEVVEIQIEAGNEKMKSREETKDVNEPRIQMYQQMISDEKKILYHKQQIDKHTLLMKEIKKSISDTLHKLSSMQ